ncbi:MAG: glycosyltransferase [Planctomycetota bacterium]|nr:glycosyltransferase [Planctomycetota bacterium]
MQTVVHVTHEAINKIGGIGAVLHGLLTSRTYLDRVPRNILVGPFWPSDESGESRLGPQGEVLYSSLDSLYRSPLAARFREIEQTYDVGIVYGRRRYFEKETGVTSTPEVLLIDVARYDAHKINEFKFALWKTFGIESAKYENIWDFEQYMRLAQPAIAALHALGAGSDVEPCVILSHEYMGMPTALAAIMEGEGGKFRTIFHAHEVAPMRRIVEHHPGHDTMFYNVMRSAIAQGHYVEDVFGDQSGYYKHALVKAARFCDGIFAVGDYVLKEIRFMGPDFVHVDSQVAYNGVPHWKITVEDKMNSRNKLRTYCNNILGFQPDYVFSHVTRLVPSKGMWRDLRVLEHVEKILRARNETAVLFALSTEVPARRGDDIRRMEQFYHWPVAHREGLPDLSNGEAVYYQGVQEFNARSRNVKVVFINQFGWEAALCGTRMSADMEFMDIRKGSDVEFGQSIYEPFGIAQVEPISFGGICVFTNVCGCAGFVDKANDGKPTPNVIVADYTDLPNKNLRPEQMMSIGQPQRDEIEHTVSGIVAKNLVDRLPRTPKEFEQFVDRGFALASRMSWDVVAREYVLPGIVRATRAQRLKQIA